MTYNLTITNQPEYFSPVCNCTIPALTYGLIEELGIRVGGNDFQDVVNNAVSILKGRGLTGKLHIVK